jgi:hypothetical protein
MTALPADIAAGTREATLSSWQDPAIKARHPGAGDALSPPAEGFFDNAADARAAANQRGALIGVERRRFAVPAAHLIWSDPTAGVPCFTLIDQEQAVNLTCLAARIELDLDSDITTLELFG